MILSEFEVKFVPQKAVKGQVLVDFLAAHPVLDNGELSEDFPDKEVFNIEASSWQSLFSWGCKKIRGWSRSCIHYTIRGFNPPTHFPYYPCAQIIWLNTKH